MNSNCNKTDLVVNIQEWIDNHACNVQSQKEDIYCFLHDIIEKEFDHDFYDFNHVKLDTLNERITKKTINEWVCTDTHVGYHAFYLDNEIICISVQTARKNPKVFFFTDKETRNELHRLIIECMDSESDDIISLISNLEVSIPQYSQINFGSNYFNGDKRKVYDSSGNEVSDIVFDYEEVMNTAFNCLMKKVYCEINGSRDLTGYYIKNF
jgi:hypothetical protein